jgi:two-component system, LuxR family, response regulator FixJ
LSHIKAAAPISCFLDLDRLWRTGGIQMEAMKQAIDSSRRRPVVIIVDDDPAVRNSLKFSLEIDGFDVRSFASGTDLLDAYDVCIGSCLIIDQRMPGMTGLDLIATLRDRHISAPAILITSHPNAAVRSRAAQAGIPIIEKPLLGNALVDGIRDAFAQGAQTHS